MLLDKHKIEKEQNAQLRNQVAQLLQMEQEQKLQMQQRDSTIETFQVSVISVFLLYLQVYVARVCMFHDESFSAHTWNNCLSYCVMLLTYESKVINM